VRGLDQLYEIGCSTVLREAKSLPDGRFDVVTQAAAGSACANSTASPRPT